MSVSDGPVKRGDACPPQGGEPVKARLDVGIDRQEGLAKTLA
jgi:hypothetical protein